MLKQCYFQQNYIRTLLICSKMPYFGFSSLGGNTDFLDFLQKQFYIINYRVNYFLFGKNYGMRGTYVSFTASQLRMQKLFNCTNGGRQPVANRWLAKKVAQSLHTIDKNYYFTILHLSGLCYCFLYLRIFITADRE